MPENDVMGGVVDAAMEDNVGRGNFRRLADAGKKILEGIADRRDVIIGCS
jgi:hypothetical protein